MRKTFKIIRIICFATIILTLIAKIINVEHLVYGVNSGVSMEPTFVSGKQNTLSMLNKNAILKRGDIINYMHNDKTAQKRLIGLPGDRITFEKENKLLYLNGNLIEKYDTPFYKIGNDDNDKYFNSFDIVLKEDEFFAVGDNVYHSNDCRVYGPQKLSSITSKVIIVYNDEQLFINQKFKNEFSDYLNLLASNSNYIYYDGVEFKLID